MASERPDRLTHKYILKEAEPGRHGDGRGGHGLSILITERTGGRITRTWSQRVQIKGQVTNVGLGSFPAVSLANARAKAADNARKIALGEDIRQPPPMIPTLNEVIDQVMAARSRRNPSKKTVDGWHRLKARCASIGSKPVSAVTVPDILEIIEPLWGKSTSRSRRNPSKKTVDGWHRLKARCASIGSKPVSAVTVPDILEIIEPLWGKSTRQATDLREFLDSAMKRAIRYGYRTDNPATSDITEDLGKPTPPVHHESLPHGDVGENLAIIRDAPVWWAVRYGLEFLALTSTRSADVREAEWEHFDLESDQPIWHIPKTKNGLPHDVPLSTHAVEIVLYAEEKTGRGHRRVFPPELGGDLMDDGRFSKLMKTLLIPATPHGFRSSFRNWAGGRGIPDPVAERVLAHKPPNQTVEAYLNSPFLAERAPVMQRGRTTSPRPWELSSRRRIRMPPTSPAPPHHKPHTTPANEFLHP